MAGAHPVHVEAAGTEALDDDVGVGEQLRAVRARDPGAEVDRTKVRQGSDHVLIGHAFPLSALRAGARCSTLTDRSAASLDTRLAVAALMRTGRARGATRRSART